MSTRGNPYLRKAAGSSTFGRVHRRKSNKRTRELLMRHKPRKVAVAVAVAVEIPHF